MVVGLRLPVPLGHADAQYAVGNLSGNLLRINIVGQAIYLLIVAIVELTAQIAFLVSLIFLILLVLHLVLDSNLQVAVVGDLNTAELLSYARSGNLHCVALDILLYIDGWRVVHSVYQILAEEIFKHGRHPITVVNH